MSRLLVLAILGAALTMLPSPASADSSRTILLTRTITDFTDATPDLGWIVVNDGVMGGRSRGDFSRKGGAIHFRGSTNTRGGGFSSIRTRGLELDLGRFQGIRVHVLGDGRTYTWRLTTDARWRGRTVSYRADFPTEKGRWTEANIPFASFEPRWRGRKLSILPLNPAHIRGMGLMIYDKKDGPFAIRLDSVAAYSSRAPFALRDVRWKKRVLVIYAPDSAPEKLGTQLANIAETPGAFAERDMLLVVLRDTSGSRAGDLPLTSREARDLRESVRIEPGRFALRLVGKDGGVKRAAAAVVPMPEIYEQIDSMPMRQREMRRAKRL